MLVLTRRRRQSIVIGDDIEVMICEIYGDKVRLGITARREIPVHRKEVAQRLREQRLASSVDPADPGHGPRQCG